MRRSLALLLLLSACAGPRTHELVSECWQDDPASLWVLENGLDIRARTICSGDWTLVSKREIAEPNYKEIHWTVACHQP